jgi:hypothetical protein
MIHGPMCPRIKAIEYYPNGTVKRIEYRVAAAMPSQGTVGDLAAFPGMAHDDIHACRVAAARLRFRRIARDS